MTAVILSVFVAGLFGFGLVIVVRSFVTPAASLNAEWRRAQRVDDGGDWLTRFIERFGGLNAALPYQDLEILGWSKEFWYRRRVSFAAVGFGIGCLLAIGLRFIVEIPLVLAIPLLGFLVAGIAVMVADSDRTTQAQKARDEMRLALTYFLEIASIMLAGGAGAETALESSASKGHGPSFARFSREIARSKNDPTLNAFAALGQLGSRVGVPELVEFGDVMVLSSENAATVTKSLQDKASLLIFKEQERRKAAALSQNVMMSIPVAGIAGGFIVWLVYPAIAGLANF